MNVYKTVLYTSLEKPLTTVVISLAPRCSIFCSTNWRMKSSRPSRRVSRTFTPCGKKQKAKPSVNFMLKFGPAR